MAKLGERISARDIGVHSKADRERGGAGLGLIVAHRERHDKVRGHKLMLPLFIGTEYNT